MNLSYKTVVNYVKNLFPGIAPSDNPALDAQVINYLATNKFYTVASNGHRYWYCFVENADMQVAKYILHSNGVMADVHSSRYYFGRDPVLRVRTAALDRSSGAHAFVNQVMKLDRNIVDDGLVNARIEQIRQKMK